MVLARRQYIVSPIRCPATGGKRNATEFAAIIDRERGMQTTITFGHWLKERRQALDLTQEGLAERVDCSLDPIRKIEAGTRPPPRQSGELLPEGLGIAAENRPAFLHW